MAVSYATFERVALEDRDRKWELVDGCLREKPGMTTPHNDAIDYLDHTLRQQLDREQYTLRVENARLRAAEDRVFVPDLFVLPQPLRRRSRTERPTGLEVYAEPMPLVVEVWSPSTGRYDLQIKLPAYQARGDAEIWYIHPYDRTLTAYCRQPDGAYRDTIYREGVVESAALPGVRIELAALFA